MCARYLGLVLLVWFAGVLHAQSAPQSCSAPSLDGGFLVPQQDVYPHETTLRYACNKGLKPAVEGWWATITCRDGTWSHKPQCIDKKACFPLDIPNAKETVNHRGWYEDRHTISLTCNEGYEPKSREVTCENGVWTPVPVCEKSSTACGAPPQIPHAVIILQRYQEVFAANSKMQYECEEGYTVEGGDSQNRITCRAGEWTTLPTCSAGQVETAGGPATSSDSQTQPANGGSSSTSGINDRDGSSRVQISRCGVVSVVPDAVVVEEEPTFVKYKCNVFYKQVGPEIVYCNSNGRWTQLPTCEGAGQVETAGGPATSSDSQTQPANGGSSSTSGINDRDGSSRVQISRCGVVSVVPDAVVVEEEPTFVKYKCNVFYKQVGPEIVYCNSNGRWTQLPTCEVPFCELDPAKYTDYLRPSAVERINEGQQKFAPCHWPNYVSSVRCINGQIQHTACYYTQ